ncbi:MAG: cytidylyltransferase domain-containing protein [Thermoplasmata archaeon]
MIALIPIGKSKRLKDKHFMFIDGKRIIDIIVENLIRCQIFKKIIISSYKEMDIKNATVIIDYELKGVSNVLKNVIETYNENIILIGGDMPFVSCDSISLLLRYPEDLISIPRWKNGYFEPLHAYYPETIKFSDEKDMKSLLNKNMFVSIDAEKFPPFTFFNINTYNDYIRAIEIYDMVKKRGKYK